MTTYQWLYGVITVAVVFLSIVAGFLAMSLFKAAFKHDEMKAWRFMIWTLMLFALEEVVGTLKIFSIYSTPHLTHIIPSFIMGTLIAALLRQININKGCTD